MKAVNKAIAKYAAIFLVDPKIAKTPMRSSVSPVKVFTNFACGI